MGLLVILTFICLNIFTFATAAPSIEISGELSPISKSSFSNGRVYRSSINHFIEKLFDDTDTNEDGMVSFDEAYVGCLLLYVQLNRSAPIPPPSRGKFLRIFLQSAEKSKSNKRNLLDKDEYRDILKRIVRRAVLRLTSHKIATLVGAPLLTEMVVRSLASTKAGFQSILRSIVPYRFHDTVIPTLVSRSFHRSFFMVVFVSTLGNIFLSVVTFLLDMTLPKPKSVHRWFKAFKIKKHHRNSKP
mmetsp:Transcript_4954/g.12732  ORF Transcript_4954/g.12732 Transcript_4954/m.12732 type:complete len:244 (-) Transcript_4954:1998-2729(-)